MTTKVIVETHTWPVIVTASFSHFHSGPTVRSWSNSETNTFVPQHTKREFVVTKETRLTVVELPEDATSLEDDPRSIGLKDNVASTLGQHVPEPVPADETTAIEVSE